MDTLLRQRIIETYQRRAKNYDFTANLYYLIGYPQWKYRQETVDTLHLEPGDTVVEIACGTGINFGLYQEVIGAEGKIIGIDLTDAMLEQARRRIAEQGWNNVELVHCDALAYEFPSSVDAIISTYALSLIPEADQILEKALCALKPGGRLSLLELQIPEYWPGWMAKSGVWLMSPFAITNEWYERVPWTTIREKVNNLLEGITIKEKYLGMTYIISGKKKL